MDLAGRKTGAAGRLPGLIFCALAGALALLQLPWLPPPSYLLFLLPPLWLLPSAWRWRLLAACLGSVWAGMAVQQQLQQNWPPDRHGEVVAFEAWVEAFPARRDGVLRLTVRPYQAYSWQLPDRIRLAQYRSSPEWLPGSGDCVHISARLKTPSGSLNPGGFDYEGWLFREGIGATGSIESLMPCAAARAPGWAGRLARWRQGWRDQLLGDQAEGPGRGLAAALLFADRTGLDSAQWQLLRDSGTAHLMAISGLHIGLVASAFYALGLGVTRLLGRRLLLRLPAPSVAWLLSLTAAAMYAALAGFSVPTSRALLMLLVLAGFGLSGWRLRVSDALAVAAGAVFLVWPLSLLSPGFWMSFAAVGLILWTMAGRRWSNWRSWLWLQPVLALGLLPLSLHFFGGSSLLAPLANWVAVPLMGVLLPVLMLSALLEPWAAALGLGTLTHVLTALAWAQSALAWLAEVFPWPWISAGFGLPGLLALAAAMALLLVPGGLPRMPLVGLLVVSALWPAAPLPLGQARLAVLDVGQGSALVLETRAHRLLVDAGPAYPGGFDAGEQVVLPYLRQRPGQGLDRVLISHPDRDHRGGLPAVRQAFGAAHVLGMPDQPCIAGQFWHWDGVSFELLHPAPGTPWTANNGSCVLRAEGDGWSLLLPGDIEAEAEAALLQGLSAEQLSADVLVVPHHGSRTSSTKEFLRAVRPRVAVISAGWRHHYGHPHDEVVARLRQVGAEVMTTAESGALMVHLGSERPIWHSARDRRRLWSRPTATTELQLTAQTR